MDDAVRIVIVGAGPRAVMLLERLSANQADTSNRGDATPLHVTLVDPHPPGAGRIWRHDQSPLLKLNSMAKDVTVFTDESCRIAGPVTPGPSLIEWAEEVRSGLRPEVTVTDAAVQAEIAALQGGSFPTRRLNSAYLGWFHESIVRDAPESLAVTVLAATVLSVVGGADEGTHAHRVELDTGETLDADIVVYAVGHNAREQGERERQLLAFAGRNGFTYVAPDFTADADLSRISAGRNVIVRGMGLAATDLVVLLFEGRGGSFSRGADGRLAYVASGQEPIAHLGSRRGVPYRSKITSALQGDAPRLEVLTPEHIAALGAASGTLDFDRDVWPLVATEQLLGYYRELFTGHPDRIAAEWAEVSERIRSLPWNSAELLEVIAQAVPDAADRFALVSFDRPLGQERFASSAELQERVRAHIADDLALRTEQRHSATQGLFLATLYAFMAVAEIPRDAWNERTRTQTLPRDWHHYFSYVASGPPGHRLEELLALAEGGLVRFLGPDVRVRAEEGVGFVADSPSTPGSVTAAALVDAWLPESNAAASVNPVLRELVSRGAGAERITVHPEHSRVVDDLGREHPSVFAVGSFTAAPESGAFTRPGINALPFRQNDALALALLAQAARVRDERALEPA
ncbi:FAD/NAD(P)-binding protein [Leifsonia sp. YIM 134122]|uniref:FAD/NAD(P)-binding protein n=1 Tax=Leifsonia stereocauli TaxID=3134136 RepID=A0ABU9W577_9MICO